MVNLGPLAGALPAVGEFRDLAGAAICELTGSERLAWRGSTVVHWPTGSDQPAHADQYNSDLSWAGILYLNDDFQGGQTFFEASGRAIEPRTGRLLVFPGAALRHGVHPVTAGDRYTASMWLAEEPQ